MDFRSDEENDDEDNKAVPITSFFCQKNKHVQQKTQFFDDRGLIAATSI